MADGVMASASTTQIASKTGLGMIEMSENYKPEALGQNTKMEASMAPRGMIEMSGGIAAKAQC